MKMISTRGVSPEAALSDALIAGLAPDGGLYRPRDFPGIDWAGAEEDVPAAMAQRLLSPFFSGDSLADTLPSLCAAAFAWPIPADPPRSVDDFAMLELFHGPTGAFKDHGARFLAGALDALGQPEKPFTVLVATSGDTGGAVGAAFEGLASARAVILFPKGRVSPFQKRQLCCWRGVRAFEVEGDFDACQALAKQAFLDEDARARHRLTSANSISLGRLLPQMAYFAYGAYQAGGRVDDPAHVIIPTGNMGNALACLWARACGAPIGRVVLAVNANRTLADYFDAGAYEPRASIATLANAMDVGDPSNFERFAAAEARLGEGVSAVSIDDAAIKARIRAEHDRTGRILCPHTATGAEAHARLANPGERWLLTATAHPYKFRETVEPELGEAVAPSPALAAIFDREARSKPLEPGLDALKAALSAGVSD